MKHWEFKALEQGKYEHNDNGAGGKYEGKLVLRPSSLDSYVRCPYSFYKQQIKGEYGAPSGASQIGTALHYVMEVALQHQLSTGDKLSLDDMHRVGVKAWKDYNEKADIVMHGDQTYQTLADDLYASTLALNEAIDCIEVTATESRHSLEIVGHPLFSAMSGSLDVEIPNGVLDLKNTGKKKSNPQDYLLQQSSYVWLKQINGIPAEKFNILNIVRPTKAKKAKCQKDGTELIADWHILEGEPNVKYVKHWVNIILTKTEQYDKMCSNIDSLPTITEAEKETEKAEVAELIFQGTSPSNSFLCNSKWCSSWTSCPHTKALRDAEEFKEVELFGGK